MPSALPIHSSRRAAANDPQPQAARYVYYDLLRDPVAADGCSRSRRFLAEQLQAAAALPVDLPETIDGLWAWAEDHVAEVGRQYRAYLDARRAGAPRRYFSNKSHALFFLKSVAPTKLVDGAWLYGLLPRWRDARCSSLIRIYLEELGNGVPEQNHVLIYRRLLAAHGCEGWERLDDGHYVQGAIQLALARHTAEFLPEVIGYNLGYEQLPLHLLITAYELNELGIDPYYFTLHVTVDNAASGHAKKAVQGVLEALPQHGDAQVFYQRVVQGYKLNELGAGTLAAIAGFDLQQQLVEVLTAKAAIGSQLHSDYCRLGGRTVNDWLSGPTQIPAFLRALQSSGWVRRHQDPQDSRFWRLIQGESAAMFGVFTGYEQQLIYDWIAGDFQPAQHRRSFRQLAMSRPQRQSRRASHPERGVFRRHSPQSTPDEFMAELRALEAELAALDDKDAVLSRLVELLSPAHHHTAAGLMAARIFSQLFV